MRWLILSACALVLGSPTLADPACPPERIDEAFLLAFPVSEMVRTRAAALGRADAAGSVPPLNRFRHRPQLSTPADRGVTAPNVDTLYSAAWFDLSAGSLHLEMPAVKDRYASVAVMDMAGDHVAVLHPASDRVRRVALIPPSAAPPPEPEERLHLPIRRGWMIARVFVAGPEDVEAARAVQTAISLSGPVPPPPAGPVGNASPELLLATVNAELKVGPAPQALARSMKRLSCTGLGADAPAWLDLPEAVRARWTKRVPQLLAELQQGFATGPALGGWQVAHPATGTPEAPDRVRAAIALSGLGALPTTEAIYFRADVDSLGRPLDGNRGYRLRLPADMPGAAFWSLTLYERTADGRLFLAPNARQIYAINSASRGLRYAPDGAIPIRIAPESLQENTDNWLPAVNGPISLIFRIYRPVPQTIGNHFVPPPIDPEPAVQ